MLGALAALWGLMATAPAHAQAARPVSDDAEARAIIVTQNSFFLVQDLHFGDIIAGTQASTIRLFPDGTRTRLNGNATLVGNSHQPARFAGKGRRNQLVLISITDNTIQLTGPGAPMNVNLFEIGSTPTALLTATPISFRITSTNGIFNFPVGARLTVNANQARGLYTGTFEINLDYL